MLHFSPVSAGGKLGLHVGGGEEVLHWGGSNFTLSPPGMVTTGLAPRLVCLCGAWPVVPKPNEDNGWMAGGSWGGSSAGMELE